MSFRRSNQSKFQHLPDDDDVDEELDLPLEELDPISRSAIRRSSSLNSNPFLQPSFGQAGRQSNRSRTHGSLSPGTFWRTRVGRSRSRSKQDEEEEDLQGLLEDGNDLNDSRQSSMNRTEDDAPLLNGIQGRQRRSSVVGFMQKLKATPQSEIDGDFDTADSRIVLVGQRQISKYPPNIVSNAKYTPWSFLPRTLYNEFSFFFNLYFLLVALSQVIPQLRIGYLSTYIAPLAFVLTITLGKEAFDDITRRRRDAEANSERFTTLSVNMGAGAASKKSRSRAEHRPHSSGRLDAIEQEENHLQGNGLASDLGLDEVVKTSKDLRVGDIVKLGKDQRVPADAVILRSYATDEFGQESQDGGEAFIRTDQLDGETDWKLRVAPTASQVLENRELCSISISAGKPDNKVNEFVGTLNIENAHGEVTSVPLTIDHTAWANTVIASNGVVLAAIIYTGSQTRQAMSTSSSRTKTGLLEYEINNLTKILCALTLLLSFILVAFEGFKSRDDGNKWYIAVMRYLILFSTIVPISLRVNLDMGKTVYAWFIEKDRDIPGTVVRSSTIPEDLGRIEYLLTDKTGTLTQNDMQLRKIHVGTVSYANDAMTEVTTYIRQGFGQTAPSNVDGSLRLSTNPGTRSRREIGSRVRDLVVALALCHNVTPTSSEEKGEKIIDYQASSPDEIAIVKWTESVGLQLVYRDRYSMILESVHSKQQFAQVEILSVFPFTSEGKRMGIIVKFVQDATKHTTADVSSGNQIWFFQKGADTVMSSIVASNDWLDEETANMAREGLRTLVVGRKRLSQQQYQEFASAYRDASLSMHNRDGDMAKVVGQYLEQELELLGVTGVEDKLQYDVKPSLELLRNAGVKIWMLTGDKVETARCVALSSKLVGRGQYIHTVAKMNRKTQAQESLDFLRGKSDSCLLIDGESLALMLDEYKDAFISTAVKLSAVVACRCSPNQKAEVAKLIRAYTKKRVCCIGDGGNDVSMIQAADVGVGIVGKEGHQASLAADFSILQFCHLTKLLVWHGRNSYKRSAKLAQFVMHRGLIISVCQTVFSIAGKFEPKALYRDWLLVGYATIYTMFPVFSLVLDKDIPAQLAHLYPELYAELSSSRSLSYKTFFVWVAISVYQGCVIQLMSQFLAGLANPRMVSVSYTALILNELVMVAAEVTTWHWVMVVTIVGTAGIYFGSLPLLGDYFDLDWILTPSFWWRVAAIAGVSLVPVYGGKMVQRCVRPESYRKVQQGT